MKNLLKLIVLLYLWSGSCAEESSHEIPKSKKIKYSEGRFMLSLVNVISRPM
jgi:hypothetical protein